MDKVVKIYWEMIKEEELEFDMSEFCPQIRRNGYYDWDAGPIGPGILEDFEENDKKN